MTTFWALSSFGRAPPLQGGGGRFEPDRVHHKKTPLTAWVFLRHGVRERRDVPQPIYA